MVSPLTTGSVGL